MPAPTVPVTVDLSSVGGVAIAGVTVRARLDRNEVHEGMVISEIVEAVTDAGGVAVLNLFPNAPAPTGLGTQDSTYRVHASIPGRTALNVEAKVPNIACRLEDILVPLEATPLSDAQLAVLQLQELLSQADQARQDAEDARDVAIAARDAAIATAFPWRTATRTNADGPFWVLNGGLPISAVKRVYFNGQGQDIADFVINLAAGSVQYTGTLLNFTKTRIEIDWL